MFFESDDENVKYTRNLRHEDYDSLIKKRRRESSRRYREKKERAKNFFKISSENINQSPKVEMSKEVSSSLSSSSENNYNKSESDSSDSSPDEENNQSIIKSMASIDNLFQRLKIIESKLFDVHSSINKGSQIKLPINIKLVNNQVTLSQLKVCNLF